MAKYFKAREVAEHFNISKSAVNNYVKNGIMPAPKRIGHSLRWSEEQLEAFEAQL